MEVSESGYGEKGYIKCYSRDFSFWLPWIPHFGGGSKPVCFIVSKLFLENESQNRKFETDLEACVSFFISHSFCNVSRK